MRLTAARQTREITAMQHKNVLEYLEATAQRVPDKVAFAGDDCELTFAQLHEQSRAVGSSLLIEGISGEPVVVFMSKSPVETAAFFGCIYAGCSYVPIDPEMPRFRTELIFRKLSPRAVICRKDELSELESYDYDGKILCYEDMISGGIDDETLGEIRRRQIDTDPIYIMYTSGSTGVPKGVIACHRSVIDYIEKLSEVLGITQDTVFANQTPLYFDASMKEVYPTIMFGATTYLVPKQLFMFPLKLIEYLNEHKVNTICWVVSALVIVSSLGALKSAKPEYLKTVAFGGEVFPVKQFGRWKEALPEAEFFNLYGPTEITGVCCYYRVDREFEKGETIPVGKAFDNTDVFLLTDDNKRAQQGEVGEICVRGTSVTLGYYNDFERTSEAFVQNPLNDKYPEIIYKTGDLGKLNERGEIVFVSRRDHQIKHMGHRIELGEIEVNVGMLGGVAMCACLYNKQKDKIELFYTGDTEQAQLLAVLKEKLPRYMLPNRITRLEKMPLTVNGKIDRVYLQGEIDKV